jgi:hypothetical protein
VESRGRARGGLWITEENELTEVHGYLVTGTDEQRIDLQLATGQVTNWLELRGQTAFIMAFDEHLDGFLKLATKCGVTVQRIEGAGDNETFRLLVGEEKSGWTDRAARDWAAQQLVEAGREHREFVEALLTGAPDSWDRDDTAESIAVDYVRHLEAEVDRLGGSRKRFLEGEA